MKNVLTLGSLYDVGTKVLYKYEVVDFGGSPKTIGREGEIVALGPDSRGKYDYLVYFEYGEFGWVMADFNSDVHSIPPHILKTFKNYIGKFTWASKDEVARIEDDMVTIDDIKQETKKLQDMIDEFKKSPKEEKENNGFMFKAGDLVEFKSDKGLVYGVVIFQHFKGTFGVSSEHIVYLPNDYRGFGFQELPAEVKGNFAGWEDRCGTFVYARERDLNRIYRICKEDK